LVEYATEGGVGHTLGSRPPKSLMKVPNYAYIPLGEAHKECSHLPIHDIEQVGQVLDV
jgi:hypothetical protein